MKISTKGIKDADSNIHPNIKNKIKEYLDIRLDGKKVNCKEYGEEAEDWTWSESYKWDILPKVHKKIFSEKINNKNILDKIEILRENNPTSGSFVHWSNIDDLKKLAQRHPRLVANFFNNLGDASIAISEKIDTFITSAKKKDEGMHLGTPLFGYIFAVFDYNKYPIYKNSTYLNARKLLGKDKEWKSFSLGEKYQKFTEICFDMGQYFKENNLLKKITKNGIDVEPGILALDGQDFFYITEKNGEEVEKDLGRVTQEYKDQLDEVCEPQYWTISPGKGADMWEEFYEEGIIGIGWDKLGDFSKYKEKQDFKKALKMQYKTKGNVTNDTIACFDFYKTLKKGDFIFAKKGLDKIIGYGQVISDYIYDGKRDHYKHIRKVKWLKRGEWNTPEKMAIKTLTDLTPYGDFINKLLKLININMKSQPKNLILYGPPGTGKTHRAIEMAEELLSGQAKEETREERIEKIISNLTWFQIIGIVLFLNKDKEMKVREITESEYLKVFSGQVKKRTGGVPNTIWRILQDNADEKSTNISTRNGLDIFHKNEKSKWSLAENGIDNFGSKEYSKIINELANIKTGKKDWKEYYKFITFHQSYSYEEFIEGIRPVLGGEDEEGLQYKLKPGIFKIMCQKAKEDKYNNYLLIIDEINRGNISKIFGELITLVEDNKRLGAENEIKATLPYSGEEFGVPSNLYIIGTMNTADRSIALLDIALRRRFKFQEIAPDHKLAEKVNNLSLSDLLKKLNQKIEVMIDRDHKIGHSYFMKINNKEELSRVWYDEIIPLLQEYFYNDWEKLEYLLGKYKKDEGAGFIEKESEKHIHNIFSGDTADEFIDAYVAKIHEYSADELIKALKAL